ncbi:hypothetical protein D1AOALGA4SA_2029 [Olavius algarvensis Delta 1 endosymbiont]|nr:hypothetical protein D1AOALGA4SA_2029 [Olavius algarvensis Delta 1 endosymbiont]
MRRLVDPVQTINSQNTLFDDYGPSDIIFDGKKSAALEDSPVDCRLAQWYLT